MRRTLLIFAVVAAVCSASGCRSKVIADSAPGGAAPVTDTPVGPVPGGSPQPIGPTNPYGTDRAAAEAGRKLFVQYNCYGCHGGHAGGGMGPSLRDQSWIYGSSDAEIFNSIAQGRSQGMPAWGTKLPTDQIWQLVSYVKTLRTDQEADPPSQ